MKKFLLGLLMAIMCIGMAACTPSSVEKAEEKMQEAGYTVVAYEDEDAEGIGWLVRFVGRRRDDGCSFRFERRCNGFLFHFV